MTRFVTFRRGGQPGRVAVNAELVTDVRSSAGPFTDIFMGDHQVTVDGTFDTVLTMLAGAREGDEAQQDWLKRA
ncbi:hypothetical protein [Sphingosinicella sp.]|uniref:hypothetical protein n=1 Tax=Sphingosinicella sp. TaxID=1917971 RepID=UPI00403837B6